MTDVRAAFDPNRLPWLTDTAAPPRKSEWRPVILWGALAMLMVAALGYWAGMRSVDQIEQEARDSGSASQSTIALPEPRAEPAEPARIEPSRGDLLEPIAPPPVVRMNRPERAAEPPPAPVPSQAEATPNESAAAEPAPAPDMTAAAPAPVAAMPQPAPPAVVVKPPTQTLWPADVSQGAAGRAVRIGTYASRLSAKRAWARLMRVYPGIRRLKAVVVPLASLRNGRTYYRLQFGTTSQAHSAVLCQRMRIVGQSCVVVGAPGA